MSTIANPSDSNIPRGLPVEIRSAIVVRPGSIGSPASLGQVPAEPSLVYKAMRSVERISKDCDSKTLPVVRPEHLSLLIALLDILDRLAYTAEAKSTPTCSATMMAAPTVKEDLNHETRHP